MSIVVPAILPTSRADLEGKLARFATVPEISRVQIDVVDGRFAAPPTWPFNARGEHTETLGETNMLPLWERFRYDIDLMVSNPEQALPFWIASGATSLTVHLESTTNISYFIKDIRETYGHDAGFLPGVLSFGLAVGIETDLTLLDPHVACVDYVQFMGIAHIGKQGQPFDERVLHKIKKFRGKHPHTTIQVDGGVSLLTAPLLLSAGVDRLVVGSGLSHVPNLSAEIRKFDALVHHHGIYE